MLWVVFSDHKPMPQRFGRADFATRNRRLPEAGDPAGGLPLVPAAPAVGLSSPLPALGHGHAQHTLLPRTSHQHPLSEVVVDARARRPGDTDLNVTCMAAGRNKYLPPEAATGTTGAQELEETLPAMTARQA